MDKEKIIVKTGSTGIGFWGMLTLCLILLKLMGLIEISWWWIIACFFAPLLMVAVFLTLILGGFLVFLLIKVMAEKLSKR